VTIKLGRNIFPKRQPPASIQCLSESRVLCNVKHFLVLKGKSAARPKRCGWFFSRAGWHSSGNRIYRKARSYTHFILWGLFFKRDLTKTSSVNSYSRRVRLSVTQHAVYTYIWRGCSRGALFLKWNPKLSPDDDDGRNF